MSSSSLFGVTCYSEISRPGIEIQELNSGLVSAFVARPESQLDSPILELIGQDITVSRLFYLEKLNGGRLRFTLYSPNALIGDVRGYPYQASY